MVSVVQDSTRTIFISSVLITEKYYTNLHCQLEKKNVIKNNGLFQRQNFNFCVILSRYDRQRFYPVWEEGSKEWKDLLYGRSGQVRSGHLLQQGRNCAKLDRRKDKPKWT
jgi:hypothetical protein